MNKKAPFKEIFEQLKADDFGDQSFEKELESLTKQRLKALYMVSQQINTILDPDKLFVEVQQKIAQLMNAERVVILLKKDDDIEIRAAHNLDDQSEQNALRFSRSIVTRVMNKYKPLFSRNALRDEEFSQFQTIQKLEILSFICVPIVVNGEAIGTIYVDNRHFTNVFDESDLEFLQAFAYLLGTAIRNSLAYRQIEVLNRTLEKRVQARTAKLRQTIKKLENTRERLVQTEKMAGLGRLIAGFLHEFNNPINFIYSNLTYLEEYSGSLVKSAEESLEKLPPEEKAMIEKKYDLDYIKQDMNKLVRGIREGAQRSRKIVNDLKNFSGSGSRSFDLIDWNENLKKVVEIFRQQTKKDVEFQFDFKKEIFFEGIKAEINHAILNILQNAVDAGANHISITTKLNEKQFSTRIEDNGSGIKPDQIPKIFDPFYSGRELGQGMGLGLSIVYGIISYHNGKIEVTSKPGAGTTFLLTLPLRSAAAN